MRTENPEARRRSSRILWRRPVVVIWAAGGEVKQRAHAETEVVNAHGALLRLDTPLPSEKQVELLDPRSNESEAARVVWSRRVTPTTTRAGVELNAPSEMFWGIKTAI